MATTKKPAGLKAAGKKLWDSIVGGGLYVLRPDELRVLEDACRTADMVSALEAEMAGADLVVTGSQGQPVANPILAELRQYRGLLRQQLKGLNLPDEDGREAGSRSAAARAAANARWRRTG